MTHPYPKRRFVPQAILTKSRKLKTAGTPVNTVRLVNTADSKMIVNYSRPISNSFKRGYSQAVRPFNKYSTYKKTIFNKKKEYKEKGVIDIGCSRHMIGNKCYLTDYEDYDGGFVSFGYGKDGIAETKNRTLIEAARTMLVDSKLPTTFWAEVVNTTCYVLNRALVIKPHNKTPYELIHGRPPLIDFMKPFGCLVTILNTRDYLGKYDEKANEGFFVGYFVVSKALRVFNKKTRIVEETLNIRFLENTPNVKGNGPDWLFDIDSLTISINYVPVVAGFQTNGIVGTKDTIIACQAEKKKEPQQEYILIPICTTDPLIS
nr:retrovirus-related Pol polyprotein from transposon TNT 1-94 [Tanacetum cinerariifolium]